MHVAVSEAKAQLTDLVRRAEAGEEIVLTRHGQPVARIEPVRARQTPEERRALLEQLWAGAAQATPGPSAARSQDYLYGDDGMPA